MQIRVLGHLEVVNDSGEIVDVGGPKQRVVLAMLAAHANEAVSVDRLAEAVWGDTVPARAHRSLSTYVSNLRRPLGDVIEFRSGRYSLNATSISVDALDFLGLVRAPEVDASETDVERLTAALKLWRGEPLPDVDAHGLLRAFRSELTTEWLASQVRLLEVEIQTDPVGSLARIEPLVASYPLDESLRSLHMRALYWSGRQADALRSFTDLRNRLTDELGVDPSAAIQDLEIRVLRHDLERPSGKVETPSLGQPTAPPLRYSSFEGRVDEMEQLLTRAQDSRLVTVVGPGGIGKSSLVAECARLAAQGAPIAWVSLDRSESTDVELAIARGLGLELGPAANPLDSVSAYLQNHPHLVVLDGCERRVAEVAETARRLLLSSEIRIIATSREPLGLDGEATIRLAPMPAQEGLALFLSRADLHGELTDETIESVEKVCDALDGIPLAIELAASRARSVAPGRLVERVENLVELLTRRRSVEERHLSLSAMLDWSVELLDETEASVLFAVSIFGSRFSLREAAAVSETRDIDVAMDRLVEVSLVQPPDPFGEYRLLEPIRQYARAQLDRTGREDAVRSRHASLMVTMAGEAAADEWTTRTLEVGRWCYERRSELLAAMTWALGNDDPSVALAIVGSIGRRLVMVGVFVPFIEPTERAVAHPAAAEDASLSLCLTRLGWMQFVVGRPAPALSNVERAIDIARTQDDVRSEGTALQRRATIAYGIGDERAIDDIDDGLRMLREDGDETYPIHFFNRAEMLAELARFEEAESDLNRLSQWWSTHLQTPGWEAMGQLGWLRMREGRFGEALELLAGAAALAEEAQSFRHAAAWWVHAARAADLVGDEASFNDSRARGLQTRLLTGLAPDPEIEMRNAMREGKAETALGSAAAWFDAMSGIFGEDDLVPNLGRDLTLGTAHQAPAIVDVLPTIVRALGEVGQTDSQNQILRSVPHLMDESPFGDWQRVRQVQALVRDGNAEADDVDPLDIAALYDMIRDLVEEYRTQPAITDPAVTGFGLA